MKLRSCFVANSSVCSFVVAGWPTKLNRKELAELFDIEGYDEFELDDKVYNHEFIHLYGDCAGDDNFIGIDIANWSDSDGYVEKSKISISELIEKLAQIDVLAKKLDLDPESAGIYTGNYMC